MHRLDSEMELLDIDLAFWAVGGDDEKAEPINVTLEVSIVMLIGFHHFYSSIESNSSVVRLFWPIPGRTFGAMANNGDRGFW